MVTEKQYRKVVKALRAGQTSCFGRDYDVELDCGHIMLITLKPDRDPVGKTVLCFACKNKVMKKRMAEGIKAAETALQELRASGIIKDQRDNVHG